MKAAILRHRPPPAYLLAVAWTALLGLASYASGHLSVGLDALALLSPSLLAIGAGLAFRWAARLAGSAAVAAGAELLVALGAALLAVAVLLLATTVLTQSTAPRPVDGWLARPELALGVRQVDARAWAAQHGLLPVLEWVYWSTLPQLVLASLWWGVVARDVRPVWQAATVWAVCGALGAPFYLILPAAGPADYYGASYTFAYAQDWAAMRSGPGPAVLEGYVSAPSFHVVMAGLLTGLWWRTPFRWPAVAWNLVMLPATWVCGEHYAIDLLLGALLVGAAYGMVGRGVQP